MKLPAIMLGLVLLLGGTAKQAKAQYDDVSLQSFYDELSPYGTWINDPQYGYVWRPDVDQDDFRPYYTNGRWAMTEYGNTWVSNYDWGWAPFHYGRWIYNRYNRWIWIPDTVWGPAWVDWRSGGGYYGWAPMGPSVGIHVRIGGGYRVPDFCWNFVPQSNIYINAFPRYYGYRNNNSYFRRTVIINNTYIHNNRTYYTGPRIDDIRRATNRAVTVYNINRVSRGGATRIENNRVNIYTPRPSRHDRNDRAMPQNSVNANVRTQVIARNNSVSSRPNRGDINNGNTRATNTDSRRRGSDNQSGWNRDDRNNNVPTRSSRGNNGERQQPNVAEQSTTRERWSRERMMVPERNQTTPNRPQTMPQSTRPQRMEQNRNENRSSGSFDGRGRMAMPERNKTIPARPQSMPESARPQRVEQGRSETRSNSGYENRGRSERSGANENSGGRGRSGRG